MEVSKHSSAYGILPDTSPDHCLAPPLNRNPQQHLTHYLARLHTGMCLPCVFLLSCFIHKWLDFSCFNQRLDTLQMLAEISALAASLCGRARRWKVPIQDQAKTAWAVLSCLAWSRWSPSGLGLMSRNSILNPFVSGMAIPSI